MQTIDEAETMIRTVFAPLDCRFERGRYGESLKARVYDAASNVIADLGTLPPSIFLRPATLTQMLDGWREDLAGAGHALQPWPATY